jgi:hypothetical protein
MERIVQDAQQDITYKMVNVHQLIQDVEILIKILEIV